LGEKRVTCLECSSEVIHARDLCRRHYSAWYRKHRDEAKRQVFVPNKHAWKFTPEHWWKWWQKRTPDERTLRLREGISQFRSALERA
jgi:hypothetical protein